MPELDERHCNQYTLVFGLQWPDSPAVYGTENMNDLEVLQYLKLHPEGLHPSAIFKLNNSELKGGSPLEGVVLKRFDKCILCEVPSPCVYRQLAAFQRPLWTRLFGGRK